MCGTPTTMTGTQRCDRCWELENRVQANPELARQVLRRLDPILVCLENGPGAPLFLRMEEERNEVLFSASRLVPPGTLQDAGFDALTVHYSEMLALVRRPPEGSNV